MKVFMLLAFFFASGTVAPAQNLIGYKDDEIRKFIRENRKDLNFERINNSSFMYLKYTDNFDSQTLLFFLNRDSVCHSVRIICDQSVKAEKIKEFDANFIKSSENRWIDRHNGNDYVIEVKDEKWASVITMEPFK